MGTILEGDEGRTYANGPENCIAASIQKLENCIKCRARVMIATRNNTDNTNINGTEMTRKKMGRKNNCMDISSDKQAKSLMRKLEHVHEREALRGKLNLF